MKFVSQAKLTMILTAGLLATNALAGFEQFNGPKGEMNVWRKNSSNGPGDYWFYSVWGLADLQSITTDDRTFVLKPNINVYGDGTDPNWVDIPEQDGNAWMAASTIFDITDISVEKSVTLSFDVTAFDLDPRYILTGFVKVLDSDDPDYPVMRIDDVTITNTGSHTLSISLTGLTGKLLQAGWTMEGVNANPATNWGGATVTATLLEADVGDIQPPEPNPMSFAVAPYGLNDHEVSMTATTATDEAGVEYYFTCTAGGGNDSGWQSSPEYTDTGLSPNTEYTYTVMARDLSVGRNETVASAAASATTVATDLVAPTPDPMTFDGVPEVSPISVMLTATTATDDSSVEYLFTCTSGDGNDSGWQSSPVYVDTGLVPGSNYSYTVTARDTSLAMNSTAASSPIDVTTALPEQWMVNPLTNYTGNTTEVMTRHSLAKDGLETGSVNPAAVVAFDPAGATFGQGIGYEGRDVLRTIAQNYGDSSFEAYATYVFDGASDQAAFIGMGQGIITGIPGNWGVPELEVGGVNGIVGELKTALSAGAQNCNILRIDGGSVTTNDLTAPVATNETFRVMLAYDAVAETATISVDLNYSGGAFVADQVLGTLSTTNMWEGVPVRVFVGGGEGTVVSDLIIRAETVVVADLSIATTESGVELSWQASPGQTYDVMYRDNLMVGTWTQDPTPGCTDIYSASSETLSVTSTVSGDHVYYQVIAK